MPRSKSTETSLIDFNVGGRKFTTTMDTLQQLGPDNMLVRMLQRVQSGEMDTTRDEKGQIFLDRSPEAFASILNFGRTGRISVPLGMSLEEFKIDLEFYGVAMKGERKQELETPVVARSYNVGKSETLAQEAKEAIKAIVGEFLHESHNDIANKLNWRAGAGAFSAELNFLLMRSPLRKLDLNGNDTRQLALKEIQDGLEARHGIRPTDEIRFVGDRWVHLSFKWA